MATKFHAQDDFRTLEMIRIGFVNTIFASPSLIITHLSQFFGDGKLTFENTAEKCVNSFIVRCESKPYVKNGYVRRFHFIYVKREDGTMRVKEVNEI